MELPGYGHRVESVYLDNLNTLYKHGMHGLEGIDFASISSGMPKGTIATTKKTSDERQWHALLVPEPDVAVLFPMKESKKLGETVLEGGIAVYSKEELDEETLLDFVDNLESVLMRQTARRKD